MPPIRYCAVLLILVSFQQGFSQINSPYSRYGLGDIYNSRNVASKGMGNLATAYIDYQSVNFINPASYSRLQATTFDVGIEYESRTMHNQDKSESYKSGNLTFNYLALGVPLKKNKNGFTTWGMAFGIRPYTKMNYNISETERLPGIDSVNTIYAGSGGASKAFIGTGARIKRLSIGANIGFLFGQQDISSRRSFLNDGIYYYTSNHQTHTSYNKFYADAGAQYDIKIGKKANIRLGFTGFLGQKINAKSDILRETISYNGNGDFDSVDVAFRQNNVKGTIDLPSGYTVGVMFDKIGYWMIGAEYEHTNWSDFRYYGKPDLVGNTNVFRMGAQLLPNPNTKRYVNRITYRIGFYTGKDYVKVNDEQLPLWAGTIGFGFPVRRWNTYSNQFTVVNTSLEYGKRGNSNQPLTENFFRLNIGLSLSDIWFNKRKFD